MRESSIRVNRGLKGGRGGACAVACDECGESGTESFWSRSSFLGVVVRTAWLAGLVRVLEAVEAEIREAAGERFDGRDFVEEGIWMVMRDF